MSKAAVHPIAPRARLRAKTKSPVEVVLEDGSNLAGHIFLGAGDRVLDCLNDSRPFLPFLQEGGAMLLIAKSKIAVCRPLDG